jgi:hypothetical protein
MFYLVNFYVFSNGSCNLHNVSKSLFGCVFLERDIFKKMFFKKNSGNVGANKLLQHLKQKFNH